MHICFCLSCISAMVCPCISAMVCHAYAYVLHYALHIFYGMSCINSMICHAYLLWYAMYISSGFTLFVFYSLNYQLEQVPSGVTLLDV